LDIFGDTTEPRGTVIRPLDKIFVQDDFWREHEFEGAASHAPAALKELLELAYLGYPLL
jgi:hypothetical protein